ncbi:dimethylmenaquinone methyltransferase [Nesterenkonia cremea]|uniref:Putative 4-hydroxy-4-methyl-2-oxoglutarate aldolase n=1 Tax=Nesterenkonia cremea TaxID=1882340 RepID=A0A917ERB0_9MICC|nr:dimethylmenaquinone methyltransferase [Nesterenkonia cremea]GGE79082.1 methyltransferase [Nesterenkonia cremea]
MPECVVHARPPAPDRATIQTLRAFPTAAISDGLGRIGGAPGLRPFTKAVEIAGPAFTVHTRPGDNLAVHQALDLIEPGEILVVAGGGDRTRALIGGLACHYAERRGVAGIIVDGAVRDLTELGEMSMPIFALDFSHQGPYKEGPGELGGPVAIRGTSVDTGDVVVTDEDGVAFVPRARIAEAAQGAQAIAENEERSMAAIARDSWERSFLAEVTLRHIDRAPTESS